jgi:Fic family protein
MSRTSHIFKVIPSLRARYFNALSGKESLIKIISEVEIAEQVFNSNAIENSTLTLEETEKILLKIDLARYVSEREIFEAKNLALVMDYVDNKAKESEVTENLILLLHKMLLFNIRPDIAGRFRSNGEWVRVGNYIAADPSEIQALLARTIIELNTSSNEGIATKISKLHLSFEHIHPFIDGNGRIGRVLNNFVLIRDGYVPINITFTDRAEYYNAFKEFDKTRNIDLMEQIVGKAITNSYYKRLAYLEGKNIITLAEYAKLVKTSHSNIINKAKRQTIEAFIEKGVWKIGV